MKATLITCVLIAAATIDAAPGRPYDGELITDPEGPTPIPSHHFCYGAGEACTKAKRTPGRPFDGELITDPEGPTPIPSHHFCYGAGEACTKLKRAYDDAADAYLDADEKSLTKRDALALAEETANALNAAYPEAEACFGTDRACYSAEHEEIEEVEKRNL